MDHIARLGRLWRTVRWLKPTQVLGRVKFRLQRPQPDLRPAPPRRPASGHWQPPAAREPSLVGPMCLKFLGETHEIARTGWDNPGVALLWRYNLHYFDDLNARNAPQRQAWHAELLASWLRDNPPGRGTAWDPYPTSLRIVNWIKWSLTGGTLDSRAIHSLAAQARWLTQRMEWHLLGNHLFVNAKALLFAGLFFEGPEADAWLHSGIGILARELPEQILSDGGQFERSPMYHALALEDLLDLLNITAACAPAASPAQALVPELQAKATAMLHWLRCMRHPSGSLARFNDSADGIAPAPAELERHADALGITAASPPEVNGLFMLQPSGYARARFDRALTLMDVAPIGPDYLPGHAHADTLSFELSIDNVEVLVNRGTSVYGDGERRLWERGTAAHNTVQIGAHDSSEVWGGFRVGRRARIRELRLDETSVDATHDGYCYLPGSPLHRRRWQFSRGTLQVQDWLSARPSEPAVSRWHFAPGLTLEQEGGSRWHVVHDGRRLACVDILRGTGSLGSTRHAVRFGELVDAATLNLCLIDGHSDLQLTWSV